MKIRPITEALAARIATTSGVPCRPHEGDRTVLSEVFGDTLPYTVLELLEGTEWERRVYANNWTEAKIPYQFIAYGETMQQSSALADEVRAAVLSLSTLPGAVVMEAEPEGGPSDPVPVGIDLAETRERFILHVHAS